MRNAIATRLQTDTACADQQRQASPRAPAPSRPARAPASGGRPSAAVRDLLAARLPSPLDQDDVVPAPRWGPVALLCLLAWVVAAVVFSQIGGPIAWLAAAVTLLAVPAGWLGWQLAHPASGEAELR